MVCRGGETDVEWQIVVTWMDFSPSRHSDRRKEDLVIVGVSGVSTIQAAEYGSVRL